MKRLLKKQPPILGSTALLLAGTTLILGYWGHHLWAITIICLVLLWANHSQSKKEERYGEHI